MRSVAALLAVCVAGPLFAQTALSTSAAAINDEPYKIANEEFKGVADPKQFLTEVDPNTKRTPQSKPAGHIKSLVNGFHPNLQEPAMRLMRDAFEDLPGKRVRLSAWMKTSNVQEWCGLEIILKSRNGSLLQIQDMRDRPVNGTMDWTQQQIVLNIPAETDQILVGSFLNGSGEMWTDDFQMQIVPTNVALTDNSVWQKYSFFSPNYTVAKDPQVLHDGHTAVCIASTAKANTKQWISYNRNELKIDQYRGKRIRISMWMQSSGVTGQTGVWSMVFSNTGKVAEEGERGHRPLKGTVDWKQYTVYVDVPGDATHLTWGVVMNGTGKLWVDLDSAQCVLDDAAL